MATSSSTPASCNFLDSSTVPSLYPTETDGKSTISELERQINLFDFHRSSSPGMSDLMRRLYHLRVELGTPMASTNLTTYTTTDEQKEMLRKLSQIDKFEYTKAIIMQQLGNIKLLMDERRKDIEEALASKGDTVLNRAITNKLRKAFKKLNEDYEKLKHLQYCAQKRIGVIWNSGIKPSEELLKQREQDLKNIQKHIERAVQFNRTLMLFSNNASNISAEASKHKKKKKHKKNSSRTEHATSTDSVSIFNTVTLMQESTEWSQRRQATKSKTVELKDMLQENPEDEPLPTVDISIGLEQIRRNNVNTSLEVKQLLNAIENQVQQMHEMAQAYKSELEVQCKILNRMERDVDKYEQSLQGLNRTLDKILAKSGGEIRLFCCAFLLLVILMSAGVAYFAVMTFLSQK